MYGVSPNPNRVHGVTYGVSTKVPSGVANDWPLVCGVPEHAA